MTILHPSHGGSAAAFGIDTTRSGLLCRADVSCHAAFQVARARDGMARATISRVLHELDAHQYTHIELNSAGWSFGTLMNHGGRSTIGRKKKVV